MRKKKLADLEKEVQHMDDIRTQIAEAHQDWVNANRFFDYAIGNDQIDYAIYCIITAEKRYEMLLRLAKRINGKWPAWRGAMK